MIDALARYKIAAEIMAALAVLAGLLYGFHVFCESQRQIGRNEVQSEWNLDTARRAAADAKLSAERERNINQAVTQGVQREAIIKTLAAGSAASAASLRDAIKAQRDSNNTATVETLINRANTAGDLLGDCAARYRSVAEKADRHANDVRTLIEAWPTK